MAHKLRRQWAKESRNLSEALLVHPRPSTEEEIHNKLFDWYNYTYNPSNEKNYKDFTDPLPSKSSLLRLPTELLLAIFEELSDLQSIINLADAHDVLRCVWLRFEQTISASTKLNNITLIAKQATGFGSLRLMQLMFMRQSIRTRKSYADAARCLLLSEMSQDQENWLTRSEMACDHLRLYRDATRDLAFLGFMEHPCGSLHHWYTRRFRPVTNEVFGNYRVDEKVCFGPPAKLEDIEVLMVADLWCLCCVWYKASPPTLEDYLALFPARLGERARSFASCFLYLQSRIDLFCFDDLANNHLLSRINPTGFTLAIESTPHMRTLAGPKAYGRRENFNERRQREQPDLHFRSYHSQHEVWWIIRVDTNLTIKTDRLSFV